MRKMKWGALLLSILIVCACLLGCLAREAEGQMAGVTLPEASVATPAEGGDFAVKGTEWAIAFAQIESHWRDSGSIEKMKIVFDRETKTFLAVIRFPVLLKTDAITDEKYISMAGSVCVAINDSAAVFDKTIKASDEESGYFGGVFDVYGAKVYFAQSAGDYYKCVSIEAGSHSPIVE